MADDKPHKHVGCEGCEAHRKAERDELREKLKRCCEAREAARAEREKEIQEQAEAAEDELKSLKKKLVAFQLATVVGVTILGQETFDKIMGKVEQAQEVTERITGGGKDKDDTKDSKSSTPPPKTSKPLSWGGSSLIRTTPISDLWKIGQPRVASAFDQPLVITEPLTPVTVAAAPTDTSGIGLPPITTPPQQPWAHNDWSQYFFTNPSPDITPVVVAWNTGVETGWGDGAGVYVPPSVVPTPNTFSVFALSLINNGRRRIA